MTSPRVQRIFLLRGFDRDGKVMLPRSEANITEHQRQVAEWEAANGPMSEADHERIQGRYASYRRVIAMHDRDRERDEKAEHKRREAEERRRKREESRKAEEHEKERAALAHRIRSFSTGKEGGTREELEEWIAGRMKLVEEYERRFGPHRTARRQHEELRERFDARERRQQEERERAEAAERKRREDAERRRAKRAAERRRKWDAGAPERTAAARRRAERTIESQGELLARYETDLERTRGKIAWEAARQRRLDAAIARGGSLEARLRNAKANSERREERYRLAVQYIARRIESVQARLSAARAVLAAEDPGTARADMIDAATRSYDGPRTRSGAPYVRPLRKRAALPDITGRERDESHRRVAAGLNDGRTR